MLRPPQKQTRPISKDPADRKNTQLYSPIVNIFAILGFLTNFVSLSFQEGELVAILLETFAAFKMEANNQYLVNNAQALYRHVLNIFSRPMFFPRNSSTRNMR